MKELSEYQLGLIEESLKHSIARTEHLLRKRELIFIREQIQAAIIRLDKERYSTQK